MKKRTPIREPYGQIRDAARAVGQSPPNTAFIGQTRPPLPPGDGGILSKSEKLNQQNRSINRKTAAADKTNHPFQGYPTHHIKGTQ